MPARVAVPETGERWPPPAPGGASSRGERPGWRRARSVRSRGRRALPAAATRRWLPGAAARAERGTASPGRQC
eukprot:scaffold143_cov110-Isochrysis_galbana.AAC.2